MKELLSNKPLVSVIMPAFNAEDTIVNAVNSILAQTYDNIEIIIIDDASKDKTVDVINKIFAQDMTSGKVILGKSQKQLGNAGARNIGIREARGVLIAFLDSDDVWLPDKLRKQVEMLIETGADGCFCHTMWIENNQVLKVTTGENPSVSFDHGGPIGTWVMRRGVFEKIGYFDEDFPGNVDGEFLIRFNKACVSCFVHEPLYKHYYHPLQVSSSFKKIIGFEKTLEKHINNLTAEERSALYIKMVIYYLVNNQKKFNYIIEALKRKISIRAIYLFIIMLLPSVPVTKWFVNKTLDILGYPRSFAGRYKNRKTG